MKSKLIKVFVTTTLITFGLCSTISHASENNTFFVQNVTQSAAYNQPFVNVSTLNIHNTINSNVLRLSSFDQVLNKPFFSLSPLLQSEYTSTKKYKKNELFEIATLFNDKLQQALSFFDFADSTKKSNYIQSDEPDDNTSIKLRSDCKTKTI